MERQKKGIFATEFTTSMKRLLISITFLLGSIALLAQHVIVVKKGDVKSLLAAIDEANNRNASKDAEPLFILIPDGYYDMGDRVLTRISGHRVALIGQSTEGTIIRNKPDVKTESISKTAVLQNRGWGNYYQDLTLRNDLDYYHVEPDGRAVCLQDKGDRTICNRVRMLSYQDTYYSDNEKCQHYMKETEIHGTIDFICGAGDVWFERCRIVTEKRTPDGSGNNIIEQGVDLLLWSRLAYEADVRMASHPTALARQAAGGALRPEGHEAVEMLLLGIRHHRCQGARHHAAVECRHLYPARRHTTLPDRNRPNKTGGREIPDEECLHRLAARQGAETVGKARQETQETPQAELRTEESKQERRGRTPPNYFIRLAVARLSLPASLPRK